MVNVPAEKFSDWLTLPVPCKKATCVPCGALALPSVLPLPATPDCVLKVQGDPVGLVWNALGPVPTRGVSNPGSRTRAKPPTPTWNWATQVPQNWAAGAYSLANQKDRPSAGSTVISEKSPARVPR